MKFKLKSFDCHHCDHELLIDAISKPDENGDQYVEHIIDNTSHYMSVAYTESPTTWWLSRRELLYEIAELKKEIRQLQEKIPKPSIFRIFK